MSPSHASSSAPPKQEAAYSKLVPVPEVALGQGVSLHAPKVHPLFVESQSLTDPCCGICFICLVIVTFGFVGYAVNNGDPALLSVGHNWYGQKCGIDIPETYVYYCRSQEVVANVGFSNYNVSSTSLDFLHPICVEGCPTSSTTEHYCLNTNTQKQQLVPDYPTFALPPFKVCMPTTAEMLAMYEKKFSTPTIEHYAPMIMAMFEKGWPILLGTCGLAIALSYLYLHLVQCFAWFLTWFSLITMVVGFVGAGGYFIYISQNGGLDGMPSSGDADQDLYIGIACSIVGAFFLFMATCAAERVNRAIKCVESAAECLFTVRSLLVEPLLNAVARIAIWAFFIYGFIHVMSMGFVQKSGVFTLMDEAGIAWMVVAVIDFLMMMWINDFTLALSQYSIGRCVAKWYCQEQVGGVKSMGSCLLCAGYCSGIVYHIGSLAKGALYISLTRPLRLLIGILTCSTDGVSKNPICNLFACCVGKGANTCGDTIMEINERAFYTMAIKSEDFWTSAKKGQALMEAKSTKATITALSGSTWFFNILGVAFVSFSGTFIMHQIVEANGTINSLGVQDPMMIIPVAGVICGIVSVSFMLVFDCVLDTLLICQAFADAEKLAHLEKLREFVPVPAGESEADRSWWSCGRITRPEVRAPSYSQSLSLNLHTVHTGVQHSQTGSFERAPQYAHDSFVELCNEANAAAAAAQKR